MCSDFYMLFTRTRRIYFKKKHIFADNFKIIRRIKLLKVLLIAAIVIAPVTLKKFGVQKIINKKNIQ